MLSTWLDETFKGAIFAWKTSLTDPLITWNYLNINSILTSDYFFNGKLNDLTNKKTDELNDLCKQKGWSFCLVTGSILDRWFDFGSFLLVFGSFLVRFRFASGLFLVSFWFDFGSILVRFWLIIGSFLVRFWFVFS